MAEMRFLDRVELDGVRVREDGYLVADARVARTGVQRYLGTEVGRPDLRYVDVYRSPEEVFADEAMRSFGHRPVTDDHPTESVNATNWRKYARGQTADEVRQDGKFLRVPLMVADGETIRKIEDGKRELSSGYSCELEWGDGVDPDGVPYQAQQRRIRANHVAVVRAGRAGDEVRIGDSAADGWGAAPITVADQKGDKMSEALRKVMVDGLSVNTTDEGATAIQKLIADRDEANRKLADQAREHQTALAARDAELAKRDAAIDDAKSKVLDAAALDRMVQARADLIARAKVIAKDVRTDGLSDGEIRRAVVTAVKGADAVRDKSDAYVDAAFDILADAAAKTDPLRDALRSPAAPSAAPGVVQHQTDVAALAAERQKAFDSLMQFDQTGKEAN